MVGAVLNHYRVLRPLGAGGMGEVYLAEDTRLKRHVAIKILPAAVAADPDRRARFEREAQTIAGLNHPNIVTVHSVEEAGTIAFITLEYVDGRTLADLIPKNGLPLRRLLALATQIADAVAAAHQHGIVHRDLKPANVMVTADDRVKVLDFGLAKLREATEIETASMPTRELTREGRIIGTVAYMSPEQAEGRHVDERSDIFSLGVILYEMATGERPFKGDTSVSTLSSILRDTPRTLTDVNPELPRDLAIIVRRCLAKDPDRRYQSAKDLRNELEELQQALDSGELSAPPARHRPERHWWPVAAVAALVAIGATVAVVLPRRSTSETAAPAAGTHAGKPVVILMDSTLPERVYDPETRKNGGTNADDISDSLRDLPLEVHKETASSAWRREDQVLQQSPALIVMHLASFTDPVGDAANEAHRFRDAQEKLRAFMGYAARGNTRTKFLIYTRSAIESQTWISETEHRFPLLRGRVVVMNVAGGPEHATFRDPATAREVVRRVKLMVGLP